EYSQGNRGQNRRPVLPRRQHRHAAQDLRPDRPTGEDRGRSETLRAHPGTVPLAGGARVGPPAVGSVTWEYCMEKVAMKRSDDALCDLACNVHKVPEPVRGSSRSVEFARPLTLDPSPRAIHVSSATARGEGSVRGHSKSAMAPEPQQTFKNAF